MFAMRNYLCQLILSTSQTVYFIQYIQYYTIVKRVYVVDTTLLCFVYLKKTRLQDASLG